MRYRIENGAHEAMFESNNLNEIAAWLDEVGLPTDYIIDTTTGNEVSL